jgi:hypothetical protein
VKIRPWRLEDPARRNMHGYVDNPVYANPDTGLIVDQLADEPDVALVEVHTIGGDGMAARIPVADAVAMAEAILARFRPAGQPVESGDDARRAGIRQAAAAIDQREFVDYLVHSIAPSWEKTFDRPELVKYNQPAERLDGVFHSLAVGLEGYGGLTGHRLTPKASPAGDLLDDDHPQLRYIDPDDPTQPADSRALAASIRGIRDRTITVAAESAAQLNRDTIDPHVLIGLYLSAICHHLEADYILVPQRFDDESGKLIGERADIAPGLAATFAIVWAGVTPTVEHHA